MKAWRFYGFNNMQLDEIPDPLLRAGHVIAEILCVQPSVTEAQLAWPTAFARLPMNKSRIGWRQKHRCSCLVMSFAPEL